MTSNVMSGGVDLDNIFASHVPGSGHTIATNINSASVDINQRYTPLSYGGTAASATGLRAAGADLHTLFAAKNTVQQALTLYTSSTTSSTLSTACLANTSGSTGQLGGAAVDENDTRTGYGELWSQFHSTGWPQFGAIQNPTGHGYLYDSTALEGFTLLAGNWTPTLALEFVAVAEAIVGRVYMRAYKRSSGGGYTNIVTCQSNAINLAFNKIEEVTFPATSASAMSFNTGDKLYLDIWVDITANSASGFDYIDIWNQGSGTYSQIVTPGYIIA